MFARFLRLSVATAMIFSLTCVIGCDGGGPAPAAPTGVAPGSIAAPTPPPSAKLPGPGNKTANGNKPAPID